MAGKAPGGDDGAWVCELCRIDPETSVHNPPSCVLCPRRGGVMAATNDRNFRWVHLFCTMHNSPAVFRAGTSVALPGTRAVDVRSLTREKSNKAKCSICSRKQVGYIFITSVARSGGYMLVTSTGSLMAGGTSCLFACSQGPCIACNGADCSAQFHPHCAKMAGLLFDVDERDHQLVYCSACTPDGVFR